MENLKNQLSLPKLIFFHFYAGFFITGFYVWLSPKIIGLGYPGFAVLLMAEILILTPLVGGHMIILSKQLGGFHRLIPYRNPLPWKKFIS